jgi:hypothetical protein
MGEEQAFFKGSLADRTRAIAHYVVGDRNFVFLGYEYSPRVVGGVA